MVFGLTTSVFAQNPVALEDHRREMEQGPSRVELSAASSVEERPELDRCSGDGDSGFISNAETRAQALRTEIGQKRTTLKPLECCDPNPTDVGNAAIAPRVSEKKLPAERDWFIAELKKLLTGDQ
jgi:hypothetical protein